MRIREIFPFVKSYLGIDAKIAHRSNILIEFDKLLQNFTEPHIYRRNAICLISTRAHFDEEPRDFACLTEVD